jgi:hypothetical protein
MRYEATPHVACCFSSTGQARPGQRSGGQRRTGAYFFISPVSAGGPLCSFLVQLPIYQYVNGSS